MIAKTYELPNKTRLYHVPMDKVKTILITLFFQSSLRQETATATALLPPVLERGTKKHPNRMELKRVLDNLYGASLGGDVLKKGERQVLQFSLELVNEKFIGSNQGYQQDGLTLLKEFLTEPLLDQKGFKEEYVMQEKNHLEKEIHSLLNDKVSYALERCVQEMCSSEPFGVYKYGKTKDLPLIQPDNLYLHYCQLRQNNPLDIYVIGELSDNDLLLRVKDIFGNMRLESKPLKLPPVATDRFVQKINFIEEELPVNQGKLTLGYRTHLTFRDDDYYAMLFYNGILGGFPHSKLFQNVREKANLAYYAFSRFEKHKGIMLIGSGIEVENYQKALDIINKQVEDMEKGILSQEEMENTRLALLHQLRLVEDSPYALAGFYHDGALQGTEVDLECFKNAINKVKKDDVVRVAERVELDTVYFLRSPGKEV